MPFGIMTLLFEIYIVRNPKHMSILLVRSQVGTGVFIGIKEVP